MGVVRDHRVKTFKENGEGREKKGRVTYIHTLTNREWNRDSECGIDTLKEYGVEREIKQHTHAHEMEGETVS